MPSESPEPENYSISEMMDRLKERSSGDPSQGELVVRADGTQAIKVRKRKRRSDQPERDSMKRNKRIRALQVVVVLILVTLIALTSAGVLFYFNGSAYRKKVLGWIDEATGGTSDVGQFRVTPIGANAYNLNLVWPEQNVIKSLSLNGVSAQLNTSSFLGQPWSGDEVTAASGELLFDSPTVDNGPLGGDDASKHFKFTRFRSPDMTVVFGNPAKPALRVRKSEISFYPSSPNDRAEMRITGGSLELGSRLPSFTIDRGYFGFSGRQIEVVGLRLEDPSDPRGVVELAGPVTPFASTKVSTLDIKKVENFPIEHLVGMDLGRVFSGRIESREVLNSNFISFNPRASESSRFVLAFRGGFSSQLTLSRLPFLNELSNVLNDKGYEVLGIDSGASGVLRYTAGSWAIEELRLESKSRMAVRGSLVIGADKTLSGRLEIGLPARQISTFLSRMDSLFSQPREDMRWIEVEVSGTTTAPQDDFAKRLISTVPTQSSKPVPVESDPRSRFEDATRPR
jgi:hypothetical protein